MWRATAGQQVKVAAQQDTADDEWETDSDFVNTVSEKEQRWGSKSVQGSGRVESIDIGKLKEKAKTDDDSIKKQEYDQSTFKASTGYGGKYGVQNDRVDKSAVDFSYQSSLEKHSSQTDYSKGFGGKFGVASDRKDKSAVGFEHVEQVSKHSSQTDYSKGFGGKFGVASDRKDKSAVGFEHIEVPLKHSSQTDYAKGFGGKFGVEKHMDKNAIGFNDEPEQSVGTNYQRTRAESKGDIKNLKNMFEKGVENTATSEKAKELRNERLNKENMEKEQERKAIAQRSQNQPANQQHVAPLSMSNVTAPTTGSNPISNVTNVLNSANSIPIMNVPSSSNPCVDTVQQEPVCPSYDEDAWETEANAPVEIQPTTVVILQEEQQQGIVDVDHHSLSAIALYDYTASEADELTFDPNDVITNIQMLDEGWWQGCCNGRFGLFPANYVQIIKQ